MNCRKFNDDLPEWVRGRISGATAEELTRHRDACAHCHAAYDGERKMADRLRLVVSTPPSADLWPRLSMRLDSPRRRVGFAMARRWAFGGAAAAFVVAGVLWNARPAGDRVVGAPVDEARVVKLAASAQTQFDSGSETALDPWEARSSTQMRILIGSAGE